MKPITAARSLSVILLAEIAGMFCLALWIGMTAGFAFIFAPIAFHSVHNLREFAALTGAVINRLTLFGFIAIGINLALSGRAEPGRNTIIRRVCLAGAAGLLVISYWSVAPHMAQIMAQMHGDISAYAPTSPERAAYRAAHTMSSTVYGGALLLSAVAFLLELAGSLTRPTAYPREGKISLHE